MKFLQFKKGTEIRLGVKVATGILDVKLAFEAEKKVGPTTLTEVILQGESGLTLLSDLVESTQAKEEVIIPLSEIVFAPAITNPEKIICVGFNYMKHAEEAKTKIPESPILFSKFNNALAATNEEVTIPKTTKQVDYEAELVVIIGKEAKNVSKEAALDYVFGYTVGNDISARDLQFKTNQYLLGKTPDGFAPIGPYITTSEEVESTNLQVMCEVNGELRQSGNTKDMIFDCATLISYISETMTLKPGDIIFTGTPEGVILGYPEDKQVWLKPGDEMIVTIEGLGELKNKLK